MKYFFICVLVLLMEKTYGQYADTSVYFLIHSKLDSLENSPPITLTSKQVRYVDSLKSESITNNSDSLRMEAKLSIALFYLFLVDAKFEANKKEQEIIKLQKDKEIQSLLLREKTSLLYTGLGVFVFFCIAALLIYRNVTQKQKIAEQNELLNKERIKTLEKDNQLLVADSILKGQEEERRRMANDLHDGIGGLLSGVKFSLLNMKTNMILNTENVLVFERSLDMLDHSINELRRVAHNMMPEALIKFGLVTAVNDYCDALNKTGIFKIDFQTVRMAKRITDSSEIIIYRIIQELLNNVARHANASKVLVQISHHDNHLSVTVEDNGHGFNTTQQIQGTGWFNIRSRVEYLKGKVDLLSSTKGTSVVIDFMVES